jgi:hypothetical protein
MQPLVRDEFIAFASRFEPLCGWMYLNKMGEVVTALGCVLEPLDVALVLPWTDRSGQPLADANLIAGDWIRVKKNRLLAHRGPAAAAPFTNLLLSQSGIEQLILSRLDGIEATILKPQFRTWQEWPAPAQLAAASMAWIEPKLNEVFPRWSRAARNHNWRVCARECMFSTARRSDLIARNHAHRGLFESAAECVTTSCEPTTLLPIEVVSGPQVA